MKLVTENGYPCDITRILKYLAVITQLLVSLNVKAVL